MQEREAGGETSLPRAKPPAPSPDSSGYPVQEATPLFWQLVATGRFMPGLGDGSSPDRCPWPGCLGYIV